jgi:hypothetical protein
MALTAAGSPLSLRDTLRAYLGKLVTMAAIVATLAWVPAGALLAVLLLFFGSSLHAFITFGGAISGFLGVAAWWGAGFILALVYAVWVLPYERGDS